MSDPYIGSILYFAGNFAINGYASCQGQLLAISQNTALFSILGTTYGGNGVSTFALPDLQGRVPVGQGQLAGGSTYVLGEVAGTENVTLTVGQLPQHGHPFTATGTLEAPNIKATLQIPEANARLGRPTDGATTPAAVPRIYIPASDNTPANGVVLKGVNVSGNTGLVGNSLPVSILQPYLTLFPLIALQGTFPSRS